MGYLSFGSRSLCLDSADLAKLSAHPGESDIEIFAIDLRAFTEASPNH
jgi:hypothetical protein